MANGAAAGISNEEMDAVEQRAREAFRRMTAPKPATRCALCRTPFTREPESKLLPGVCTFCAPSASRD